MHENVDDYQNNGGNTQEPCEKIFAHENPPWLPKRCSAGHLLVAGELFHVGLPDATGKKPKLA